MENLISAHKEFPKIKASERRLLLTQSSKAPHKQDIERDKKMMLKITKLEPELHPNQTHILLAIHHT